MLGFICYGILQNRSESRGRVDGDWKLTVFHWTVRLDGEGGYLDITKGDLQRGIIPCVWLYWLKFPKWFFYTIKTNIYYCLVLILFWVFETWGIKQTYYLICCCRTDEAKSKLIPLLPKSDWGVNWLIMPAAFNCVPLNCQKHKKDVL